MKINKDTINKIARLSRIKLKDKESEDYIKDLNSILDWGEQLNEVNTDNDEPLSNISSSARGLINQGESDISSLYSNVKGDLSGNKSTTSNKTIVGSFDLTTILGLVKSDTLR